MGLGLFMADAYWVETKVEHIMTRSAVNIVALTAMACAALITGTAHANGLITCSTPLTLTSSAASNSVKKHPIALNLAYIKRIKQIESQQRALDHWAQPFLTVRGFNYNNVDIVTMYTKIRERYPSFFRSYMAKEQKISHDLLAAMHKYGAPAIGALGHDTAIGALWLASRAANKDDLASLSAILSSECKASTVICGIVPTVQDRAQFVTAGTQAYGTLPNVALEPTEKSLTDLNARRREFGLPAVPEVCFKEALSK